MRILLSTLLLTLASACSIASSVPHEDYIQQVTAATDAWRAAYDSRDPKRITALYASDAALWGTNLKVIAVTPIAVAEYFKDAPARPNARVVFGEQNIRIYGGLALNSGTYTFSGVLDGKPTVSPARFSIVFRKQNGMWLIVDHHSSRLPQ